VFADKEKGRQKLNKIVHIIKIKFSEINEPVNPEVVNDIN